MTLSNLHYIADLPALERLKYFSDVTRACAKAGQRIAILMRYIEPKTPEQIENPYAHMTAQELRAELARLESITDTPAT